MRKWLTRGAGWIAVLGLAVSCWGASVLIINGASGTSEPGTTAAVTSNLSALQVAAGNTVTVSDGVPGSLSGFAQVWDVRFSNSLALTAGNITLYVSYMAAGGNMFVMGENAGFATRNASVLALITAAGGGTLVFMTAASSETVLPPFTGPNVISGNVVVYAAPGGVTSTGTGQFATTDGTKGAAVAFAKGTLSNATAGSLVVVFDVNFMQGVFDQPNSQQFLRNMIGFIATGGGPAGPAACLAHAHGHVSTGSPGHFGGIASDHTHHAQHGTHLFANPTCPPHAFGHKPGLTADTGEGLFSGASAAPEPDFVAAVNVDGTAGPARRGAALQLFGSAAGLYLDDNDEQPAINFTPPASGSPLYYTTSLPEVRIGGRPAKVLFSGLAPGLAGVWQINVVVPEDVAAGNAAIEIAYEGAKLTSVSLAIE